VRAFRRWPRAAGNAYKGKAVIVFQVGLWNSQRKKLTLRYPAAVISAAMDDSELVTVA
jgi:hypothetical protein